MCSSDHVSPLIEEVDYPRLGLDAGWPRLSPVSDPRHWRAVSIGVGDEERFCFLGVGDTDFEDLDATLGLYVAGGFVYQFLNGGSAVVAPALCRGYSASLSGLGIRALWNYVELLLFVDCGAIRYSANVAIDGLVVRDVTECGLVVEGVFGYGEDLEARLLAVEDIPISMQEPIDLWRIG